MDKININGNIYVRVYRKEGDEICKEADININGNLYRRETQEENLESKAI